MAARANLPGKQRLSTIRPAAVSAITALSTGARAIPKTMASTMASATCALRWLGGRESCTLEMTSNCSRASPSDRNFSLVSRSRVSPRSRTMSPIFPSRGTPPRRTAMMAALNRVLNPISRTDFPWNSESQDTTASTKVRS